jgi:hypothetical protein
MSLKVRSSYAILTASILALMTGCGEGASDGMEMEPEVTSDVQQVPENFVPLQKPPQEETSEVQAAQGVMNHSIGYLDRVQGAHAFGWVCMLYSDAGVVRVYIDYWDGSRWIEVGNGTATQYRPGVEPHCRGSANHGFTIPLGTNNYGYYRMRILGASAYYLYTDKSGYILTGGY